VTFLTEYNITILLHVFVFVLLVQQDIAFIDILIFIYMLTAIGLSPGSSSTLHIYTQTIRRITQITTEQHK
jgi:uncharacterized integral membrane protein